MFQWTLAQEYGELGNLEHQFGDTERLRAEALEDWDEENPSLLTRFVRVFRAEPEPFVARNRAEADLLVALRAESRRDVL